MNHVLNNLKRHLETLATFTATPGNGVTRFPFTPEARQATEYLFNQMEQMGLSVFMDNTGSVIGRLEGVVSDTVMVGSHLDSVYHGGAYDGIAGVVCAMESVRLLQQTGQKPYYSIEVIATNDEEGSRFQSGLFTGKVMTGQLTVTDIRSYKDRDGISVYDAMEAYGLKPAEIADHVRTDIKAFLEMHIEQGPVLEKAEKDIGVVDIIVGIRRLRVEIQGRPDHVGTMPMDLRKDAMEVAAKVIANIGDRARTYPGAVATVGNLTVSPNIINIVPSNVTFGVDIRDAKQAGIDAQTQALITDLERETSRFGMSFTVSETLDVGPVEMDSYLRQAMEQSAQERDYSYMHLNSGAGHDAEVFGARMPAGMIFVPSVGGRSHCPEEYSSYETLAQAAMVCHDVLVKLSQEKPL